MHRVLVSTALAARGRYGQLIRSRYSSQESSSARAPVRLKGCFSNAIIQVSRHSDRTPMETLSTAGLRGSMLGYRSKFALLLLVTCFCLSAFSPIASAQRGGVRKPAA